jgi:hypothetical protein
MSPRDQLLDSDTNEREFKYRYLIMLNASQFVTYHQLL